MNTHSRSTSHPSSVARSYQRLVSQKHRRWLCIIALLLVAVSPFSFGQSYTVSTLAGTPGLSGTSSTQGMFSTPYGIARDSNGNFYVADLDNYTIRKVTAGGVVSTLAGLAGTPGTADGVGAAARFQGPAAVVCEGSTNLYVSDYGGHTIRKIVIATGAVTTLAGQPGVSGSVDGVGSNARFDKPFGIALDGAGSLFVSDSGNSTLRAITIATGAVTTFAGSPGVQGSLDGTGTAARFRTPMGLSSDVGGNLIVADYFANTIRRVTPSAVVTTLAGVSGAAGHADGLNARFSAPLGVVVDPATNNIYISEPAGYIRRIGVDGSVSTLCGSPAGAGLANGVGGSVRLGFPSGIVVDGASNTLLVTEISGSCIRRITFGGASSWWAGTPGQSGSADSVGVFLNPSCPAIDASGNVFVADANNHVIRKVTPDGKVTTFAGSVGVSGSTDGFGANARFNGPGGLVIDSAGNLYVADTTNHTVRKITSTGSVTTIAGSAGVSGTTDGSGANARFSSPFGITVDAAGANLYVTDFQGHTLRKVVISGGVVTTLAGVGGVSGSTDGIGTAAKFNSPVSVSITADGAALYVADFSSYTIRKVTLSSSNVTTVAGVAGTFGTADGTGSAARFRFPRAVLCDASGNVFIADRGNATMRKMTPSFAVTTLAGSAGNLGAVDGAGSAARFITPSGLALGAGGVLFVADQSAHAIRKVSPSGVVSTFAGTPGLSGSTTTGYFNTPGGIVRDSFGNFYVADSSNHAIRKVSADGLIVTTLAGLPGTSGTTNGNGNAARFNFPYSIALDETNEFIYVADTTNHAIRRVNFDGDVTTVAGFAGVAGSLDGVGVGAQFNQPFGITFNAANGTLYVADYGNNTIRKIVVATGAVTTIAGLAGSATEVDASGTAARFNGPNGITIDPSGNLFVCDDGGHTIRKIAMPAVAVTTLAGLAGSNGTADGTGSAARFKNPNELIADTAGNLFVSERGNHTIRKVTPAGVVTTIAGQGLLPGFVDGTGNAVRMKTPAGLAVDAGGVLYFADSGNHVIRKAQRTSAKAQMISPANGTVLVDPVTTFTWSAGAGATSYALWVGTSPGAYDIYAALEGTNLSRTITLPVDRKIYVTLHSLISGVYQSNSYYYEPAPSTKAVVTSPANGSTLAGSSLSLQWAPGIGASGYAIWLGSSPNGYDLGAVALGANVTTWTGNVPTDGGPVYVTLWSLINGAYQGNGSWFTTAALDAQRPAVITSHANTSTFANGNVTFTWGNAIGATGYALWVGSKPDGYDLYAGLEGANLTKTLTLPTDGRRVYVTLHSLIGGVYKSNAYWFTTANVLPVNEASKINSHVNGATFAAANTTLSWNSVLGASKYYLWVGTQPSTYDLYAADENLSTQRQIVMPNDGRPVYVTLYTLKNGALLSNSYFFICANGAAGNKPALLTSPANGTGISVSPTFQWSAGSGVTSYALWVGSTPGGYDLYSANEGSALSRTVSVPGDGRKIYVTLHSLIGGAYQSIGYQFIGNGTQPTAISSPGTGSTLTSTSATFTWPTANTTYALWIGTAPRSYNLYAGLEGTSFSKTINNLLPSDGSPVYVTLYSWVNGAWQPSDHWYHAWQQP